MLKFIKESAIHFVVIFFLLAVIDLILSIYLRNSGLRKYDTWTKIINSEFQNNDLLIFGSSRAWVQISPMILDSVLGTNSYNFGIDASGVDRQIMRWNLYKLYKNKKPKYILQNIDYTSTLVTSVGYERDQFFPYILDEEFVKNIYSKADKMTDTERYIPLYRYSHYGFLDIFKEDPFSLVKGYAGITREWDGTAFEDVHSIEFADNKDMEKLFETYIQSTIADSITLVFVMTPMYYGLKEKSTQLDLMYSTYHRLSEKYNIPLLDYTFCELSKDTTLFYGALHLNKEGAELFSKQLANDLREKKIVDMRIKMCNSPSY